MNKTILPVEAIQERDIDLVLLEELATDPSFGKWFVQELNLPPLSIVNGAWHSISDFSGETDVLFSYNAEGDTIFVLIENKINAAFQKEQFERYEERAGRYIESGKCKAAFSILVAPELYCINQNDFERYISYETIAKYLKNGGTKRSTFRSQLFKIASEKLRRGYQAVNSIPVQAFWHAYWNYRAENHPSLWMKKPDIVPQNSDWPMLYDDRVEGVTFFHKLAQGNVDASFKADSQTLINQIKANLPENARLIKHSKTFSIRIFSGKIDRTKAFQDQIEPVKNGLKNLEYLRDWVLKNGWFEVM